MRKNIKNSFWREAKREPKCLPKYVKFETVFLRKKKAKNTPKTSAKKCAFGAPWGGPPPPKHAFPCIKVMFLVCTTSPSRTPKSHQNGAPESPKRPPKSDGKMSKICSRNGAEKYGTYAKKCQKRGSRGDPNTPDRPGPAVQKVKNLCFA